jgi:hypothetical protein
MNTNNVKRISLIITVSVCVALLLNISFVFAGNPNPPSYAGYKWKSSPKVQYMIMGEPYRTQASQAIDDVSKSLTAANSSFKLVKGSGIRNTPENNEIVMYCGSYGDTDWVGIMSPTVTGTYLYNVRVRLNVWYWYIAQSKYGLYGTNANSYQSVFAHELCHALGVTHAGKTVNNLACIMYPSVDNYIKKGVYLVDADTKNRINVIY